MTQNTEKEAIKYKQYVDGEIAQNNQNFIDQYLAKKILLNGKNFTPTRDLFKAPKDDEQLKELQKQHRECASGTIWKFKYSMIGAVLAIPTALLLKSYWALFVFFSLGSGYDFYTSHKQCSHFRTDIDEYMLLKAKVALEKQKLSLQHQIHLWNEFKPEKE